MSRVFIDGASGTTALQIRTLLKPWQEAGTVSLIEIENTRDVDERLAAFKRADLSILCLPDEATKETIPLLRDTDTDTRIIDASSAYRTDPEWVYGFPEISEEQPDVISKARLVTNPGCFATGAISILRPLVDASLIDPAQSHTIFGVSGYTGGGKRLIERHKAADDAFRADNAFGLYSVNARHKHVPEIKKHAGLTATPIFMPNVISQPRGMIVSVPFNRASLDGSIADAHKVLEGFYGNEGSMVKVAPIDPEQRRINFSSFTELNIGDVNPIPYVELHVTGWSQDDDNQVTIHALLDNLGKGAGAQVVQNMALMLGDP